MRAEARKPRPTRWTDECTDILKRMSAGGYTDQEIADHIAESTGERFHRNKVQQERRERLISACWHTRSMRIAKAASNLYRYSRRNLC